jgi:hypothetical protein
MAGAAVQPAGIRIYRIPDTSLPEVACRLTVQEQNPCSCVKFALMAQIFARYGNNGPNDFVDQDGAARYVLLPLVVNLTRTRRFRRRKNIKEVRQVPGNIFAPRAAARATAPADKRAAPRKHFD